MASMSPPSSAPNTVAAYGLQDRLTHIGSARKAMLYGESALTGNRSGVESWIERS